MVNMALFMIISVVALIVAIIMSEFGRRNNKRIERYGMLFLIIGIYAFIVAVVTNDPFLTQYGIPQDLEWFGELIFVGFASWRYYFNPLKERVIGLETTQGSIQTDIKHILDRITEIKNQRSRSR